MDIANNFSLNLQLLRISTGKSQTECAEETGFKRTAWNNYEKARSQPSLADLLRIAKYFGVGLSELVEHDLSSDPKLVRKAMKHKPVVNPISNLLNESPASYDTKQISKRLQVLEKKVGEIMKKIDRK